MAVMIEENCLELSPKFYGVVVSPVGKRMKAEELEKSHTFKAYLSDGVDCLEGFISQDISFCTNCANGFTLIDSICFINLKDYNGVCIQHPSIWFNRSCISCENGYKGRLCD